LRTGTEIQAEFLRIEPFFYTHWQALNTFEERGFALANDLGPNSDERWVALKQWVPWRGWVRGSLRFVRQGLNPIDITGQVVQDVGGALTSRHTTQQILFLAGDVQHWRGVGLDLGFEPWPGISARVDYERRTVTQGTRLPDRSVLRVNLMFSFYPVDLLLRPLGW